jgi:hypothetical protein
MSLYHIWISNRYSIVATIYNYCYYQTISPPPPESRRLRSTKMSGAEDICQVKTELGHRIIRNRMSLSIREHCHYQCVEQRYGGRVYETPGRTSRFFDTQSKRRFSGNPHPEQPQTRLGSTTTYDQKPETGRKVHDTTQQY